MTTDIKILRMSILKIFYNKHLNFYLLINYIYYKSFYITTMQKRIPKGIISYLILEMMNEGPTYGYEILKNLEERSRGHWDPSYGTIYGALNRMEKRDYIKRVKKDEDDRKYYDLTEKGKERLEDRKNELKDQSEKTKNMILGFLNVYKGLYGDEDFQDLINEIKKEFNGL